MPLYHTLTTPLLGIWKIEETSDELLNLIEHKELVLPSLEAFSNERRKVEWLAVRVLLYRLLGEELPIYYSPNGRPFLVDSHWHISISHTKGYAAVMLSRSEQVGIDIEYVSPRAMRLKQRFLSTEELSLFCGEELCLPVLAWSAKETAFKMLGLEDVDFREQLFILPFEIHKEGQLEIHETRSSLTGTCRIHYQITDDFVLTYGDCYTFGAI